MSLGATLLCGGSGALAQQGHTLIAQYTFDINSQFYEADSSGNNNYINGGSSWVDNPVWGWTTNAIAGAGAYVLDGGENLSFGSPPGNQTFDNWLAMFHGSFSISLWINTTNITGNDSDAPNPNTGASIIWAYSQGVNDTIPIALTGHKAAFFTGDPTGNNGDTLHSTNSVTTGTYVHIVVTRDQSSGQKTIYINGALDSSDTGVTNNLDGDTGYYAIGGVGGSSYAGILDDVQVYSGVLNASEVAFLKNNPGMTVPNVAGPSSGLVAYYDFDEGTDFAADLTDNGNNLIYGGNFGGPDISSDSISGSGAVFFDGASFLTPSTNLLSTLASNFSLSLWVKTTQDSGYDGEPAWYGEGMVSADIPGPADDLIPLALAGGGIGFNTGQAGGNDDTLNSATDINDGNYHHVVVTRNQATGEKQIYIDGEFSSSDATNAGLLNAPQLITIGALADASQSDPTSPEYSGYQGFVGLIDDIQIYSRVVSADEVAFLYANPGTPLSNPSGLSTGLVVHYDFDEGTVLAADVSGNGNDMVFAGTFDSPPGPAVTSDTESGPGALSFDGNTYLAPEGNLLTTLASNFSLSVWLQTTQSFGNQGDQAYNGAGVVTADVPGQADDLVPVALTGGYVAFGTGGSYDDVLTSTTPINDGNYHHVVVTRDQGTGEKQIYIDGAFSANDFDDGSYLNAPQILIFGTVADASQSDPNSPGSTAYNEYVGLMDQVQIYSRVLTETEVAYLYNNPGATLSGEGAALGAALGAPNLTWSTHGDASWFAETTNTYSTNAAAAQSPSLQDDQTSVLQTDVTGPGTLSFYWQTTAANDDFELVFDIDGTQEDNINSQYSWTQDTFTIEGSGTHTLTWNANTLGNTSSSPTDAGFVDQVVFTPAQTSPSPVTLLNPALTGTSFQFSFVSTADHTNYVQYSTNLANTNWLPYTNIVGDGTLKTIVAPANPPAAEFFRVSTE